MIYLILKDILIQKKIVLLSFLYIIFFAIMMQGAGPMIYPTSLTALAYMLVITSCAYDEKNKADILLNSLPLKRTRIVLAKYLAIFVYIGLGTVAYLVTTTLLALLSLPIRIEPISWEGLAGAFVAIGLINSIYFPFFFKFGYLKSRVLNFILFFTFYFGLTSAVELLYIQQVPSWALGLKAFLQSLTDDQLMGLILGMVLMLLTASLGLSIKFYQNREF